MAHIAKIARGPPVTKVAKPLLSTSQDEAKRRVINLYRAWWREVPHSVECHALDMTVKQVRTHVRQAFEKNKHVKDLRVIDMLVIKGSMELEETSKMFGQKTHVMRRLTEITKPAPSDFLTRFYNGHD